MKTAAVIGASGGLGREIAARLARAGFRLFVTGREERVLRETFPEAEIFVADLAEETEVRALAHAVRERSFDVFVHCAGTGNAGESLALGEREEQILAVNVRSVQMLSRAFAESGGKKPKYLLNVCSVSAFCPAPYFSAYAASKAAAYAYTRAFAEEMRREHPEISVTAGCPGPLATRFDERAGIRARKGMDPGQCAGILLRAMFRKRSVVCPGAGAKWFRLACRLLPSGWMVRLSARYRLRRSGGKPGGDRRPAR